MEYTTRITIDITISEECGDFGIKTGYVERSVMVGDNLTYSDRMTDRMYSKIGQSDPIRNLEIFLLGLEKRQSREDSRTDSCKLVGFFKKIRRKLFAKKI